MLETKLFWSNRWDYILHVCVCGCLSLVHKAASNHQSTNLKVSMVMTCISKGHCLHCS